LVHVGVAAPYEDFAMTSAPNEASDPANSEQLCRALGEAVVRIWGLLPPEVQHHLFEEASSHGADTRTQLALFLHGKHPRTGDSLKASAVIEPDSLGG
jgi:hypothetical protein